MAAKDKADEGPSWWDYVKKAFTWRWNLLVFGGGAAAALLSGAPDVALPLVAAAELVYLGGLVAAPKFRAAIDAQHHAENKPKAVEQKVTQSLSDMLRGLAHPRRSRFEGLRDRCLEMRRIAQGVRGQSSSSKHADRIRTPALDRMLWAFIRLLWSQQALHRFLDSTDHLAIEQRIADLEGRIEDSKTKGDEKILAALVDSLATAQLRLDNYQKAERNAEFVEIELDRIEGKIQALIEMAVSHEDPDYISMQVDSVADSMSQTEDAIREMHHLTGLAESMEHAPSIIEMGEQALAVEG